MPQVGSYEEEEMEEEEMEEEDVEEEEEKGKRSSDLQWLIENSSNKS